MYKRSQLFGFVGSELLQNTQIRKTGFVAEVYPQARLDYFSFDGYLRRSKRDILAAYQSGLLEKFRSPAPYSELKTKWMTSTMSMYLSDFDCPECY